MANEDSKEEANFCKYGCYPVDKTFYRGEGLSLKEIDIADSDKEELRDNGINKVSNIHELREVLKVPSAEFDTGQKIIDALQDNMSYKYGLGEPYVGPNVDPRTLISITGSAGDPMSGYRFMVDMLDFRYDYDMRKVQEWLNITPQSQYYQDATQKRQQAEQQVNRVLSNLSDLYSDKHMLEHDLRKVKERVKSFDEAEKGKEEALKADFVDLVDSNTGRRSIEQMQVNNVFPTIMADFYRMTGREDLKDGGRLENLSESEKAILRKKWKLYQRWKDEFEGAVRQKQKDLQRRLNSVKTSIEQTEEWLKPYVRTIKQINETDKEVLDNLTDPLLTEGYSTSWRKIKLVGGIPVRTDDSGNATHYDVLIINIKHLTLSGTEQPQSPGRGGEGLVLQFKEYLVCKHVYDLVFQRQIDKKKNEVQEYIKKYKGEIAPDEDEEEIKPVKKPNRFKKSLMKSLGVIDKYWVPPEELSGLRKGMIGPGHKTSLYLDMKYNYGMFVMK